MTWREFFARLLGTAIIGLPFWLVLDLILRAPPTITGFAFYCASAITWLAIEAAWRRWRRGR